MFDIRPVVYFIGILVAGLGATMLLPLFADLIAANGHWSTFAISAAFTFAIGVAMAIACKNGVGEGLTIRQTFVLTTGVFVVISIFAAIPFLFGATDARFVDAVFESMSGLTTTGATVFVGLDNMPEGLLLWRGMLQWLGGAWMIVVAIIVFPLLRVGGMQLFRWDGHDTMGTIQTRAVEVTRSISIIYIGLTIACAFTYIAVGMPAFDALVHSLTTIATGGFANRDSSFTEMGKWAEYVAVLFMILASLPFFRYMQAMQGTLKPLVKDNQIKGFLLVVAAIFAVLVYWQFDRGETELEFVVRKVLFNSVSIISGTGYASADYSLWGSFPVVMFFLIGLIGGCAGSTSCSIKIFRFQLLVAAIKIRIQRLRMPNAVSAVRYDGHSVKPEVLTSVITFFFAFIGTLAGVAVLLALSGLDFITSVSGAAAALANIGPGLGSEIGPSGNYSEVNDFSKWVLVVAMMIGRLELMTVYALLSVRFWRG